LKLKDPQVVKRAHILADLKRKEQAQLDKLTSLGSELQSCLEQEESASCELAQKDHDYEQLLLSMQ